MIDHLIGRPSPSLKKAQVLLVSTFWVLYLIRGPRHGPLVAKSISKFLTEHASAWQVHVLTMTGLYVLKNLDKILNLQSPEPLADIYSPSFFRATWILTALDAGFWTAMPIRPKPIRDIASLCFSIYYLIFADQADEKVRKVRATVTAEHLRISWEKATSTYLRLGRLFTTPRIQVLKGFEIARPPGSPYHSRIKAFLYYDGPRGSFKQHDKILLSFPGGGFVSMTPRHHDDSLCSWAKRLKIPIVSINYGYVMLSQRLRYSIVLLIFTVAFRKAPEYPYPYGLDECYDAYLEIIRTRGRCIGLSGHSDLQIVLIGDSAGGNLVAGTILKLLTNAAHPPLPLSVLLIYPALDLNFTSWMSDEQVRLLRQESVHELHSPGLMKRKESMYPGMSGRYRIEHEARDIDEFQLPNSIDHDMSSTSAHFAGSSNLHNKSYNDLTGRPALEPQSSEKSTSSSEIGTSLAMTSRVSYFSDKIITPEMLRAMVILYIGPHNRPDFTADYLLSPVNAPTELLAKFPKVYMLCGEVDPLVVSESRREAMGRTSS
ncbi:Alpha/Beta hydrolase protein [Myxozyma melibiosi]|uniref:Alpha/Beta hydrolase protein n=1 Tax=Myxozyma melibiosi TaxID=54550 RepID=A0ABR1FB46_9ASCO